MRQTLALAALLVIVPAAGAVAALVLDAPLVAVLLLAAVWALFVLQLASGRSGRALMAYGRLRLAAQPAFAGEGGDVEPFTQLLEAREVPVGVAPAVLRPSQSRQPALARRGPERAP